MNILVTGGNGFVGQHLLRELVKTNHDTAVISRNVMLGWCSIKIIISDLGKFEEIWSAASCPILIVLLYRLGPSARRFTGRGEFLNMNNPRSIPVRSMYNMSILDKLVVKKGLM